MTLFFASTSLNTRQHRKDSSPEASMPIDDTVIGYLKPRLTIRYLVGEAGGSEEGGVCVVGTRVCECGFSA